MDNIPEFALGIVMSYIDSNYGNDMILKTKTKNIRTIFYRPSGIFILTEKPSVEKYINKNGKYNLSNETDVPKTDIIFVDNEKIIFHIPGKIFKYYFNGKMINELINNEILFWENIKQICYCNRYLIYFEFIESNKTKTRFLLYLDNNLQYINKIDIKYNYISISMDEKNTWCLEQDRECYWLHLMSYHGVDLDQIDIDNGQLIGNKLLSNNRLISLIDDEETLLYEHEIISIDGSCLYRIDNNIKIRKKLK